MVVASSCCFPCWSTLHTMTIQTLHIELTRFLHTSVIARHATLSWPFVVGVCHLGIWLLPSFHVIQSTKFFPYDVSLHGSYTQNAFLTCCIEMLSHDESLFLNMMNGEVFVLIRPWNERGHTRSLCMHDRQVACALKLTSSWKCLRMSWSEFRGTEKCCCSTFYSRYIYPTL